MSDNNNDYSNKQTPESLRSYFIGAGFSFGVSMGVVFGKVNDNVGLGVGIGSAIGCFIGVAAFEIHKKYGKDLGF